MADGNNDEKSDYVFLRPNRRKNLRNPLLVLKVKVESESKRVIPLSPSFLRYSMSVGFSLSGSGSNLKSAE